MKTSNENLKMLLEERVPRLGDILNLISNTVIALKVDYQINVNLENLAQILKSIPTLNKYIHLRDEDFVYSILNLTDEIKSEDLKNAIHDIFSDDEDFTAEAIETSLCIEATSDFYPKIIDFSKATNFHAYAVYNAIAYDFIEKMQSKIWNGIIDDLTKNLKDYKISFYTVQKYDIEFVKSLILQSEKYECGINSNSYFLKKNIINWAMVNNLIGTEDDVNVILTDKEVIISIDSR